MGKKGGSAPAAPDPKATAGAQTAQNIGTAIANQAMNATNQVTPYGNLSWNQTGTYAFTDPLTGAVYDLPQYTATQTLSPDQQQLYNQQTRASTNMAGLAADQSAKLGSILGKSMNLSNAPGVSMPKFGQVGSGPDLKQSIADAGKITGSIADAGKIQTGFGSAGALTRTYGTDFSKDRQKVENALMARMQPGLTQERDRLSAQLANQGIGIGTEAYDRAMNNLGTQENDARMAAILGGGQEQSRLVGMEADRAAFQNSAQQQAYSQLLGRAGFANDAQQQQFGQNATAAQFANAAQQQRFGQNAQQADFFNSGAQAEYANRMGATLANNQTAQQRFGNQQSQRSNYLQEQYAARNQPINEIAALLGTGQVQNPSFVNGGGGQVANTDYAGIVGQNYQNKLQAWQAQQQQGNSFMGGLFGLGSAGIMAYSDRRLKRNIRRVPGEIAGFPLYAFRYHWSDREQVGVMAQDVERTRPDAVIRIGDRLAVHYGLLEAA